MTVKHIETDSSSTFELVDTDDTWIVDKGVSIAAATGAGIFVGNAQDLALRVHGVVSALQNDGLSVAGIEVLSAGTDIRVGRHGDVSGVYGIWLNAADGHIDNSGTVRSRTSGMAVIASGQDYLIENDGAMRGKTGEAIYAVAGGKVVNHQGGVMSGERGIWINSTEDAVIVNKGRISSDGNAVICGEGDDRIVNHGRILGAIVTGDGADHIDLRRGSVTGAVSGGGGNDVYFIDKSNVEIWEDQGKGYDLIWTTASFQLDNGPYAEIEFLGARGRRDITLIGNQYGNTLAGNAGNNTLSGGAGKDSLYSGAGRDLMIGGADGDSFVFRKGDGVDTVSDFGVQGADHDVVDLHFLTAFKDFDDVLAVAKDTAEGVLLKLGHGDRVLLDKVTVDELQADHFVYAP
ncbi:MAG: calcium-binding protein [Rhizobiaceae bacterium]|nr:calcium-binding protein [Rhizobiaceae bacterium]